MFKKLKAFTLSRLTTTPNTLGEAPSPPDPRHRSLTLSQHNIYYNSPYTTDDVIDQNNNNTNPEPTHVYLHSNSNSDRCDGILYNNGRARKANTLGNRYNRSNGNPFSHRIPIDLSSDEEDDSSSPTPICNGVSPPDRNGANPDMKGPPLPPRAYNNRIRAATLPLHFADAPTLRTSDARNISQPPLPPRRKHNGHCDDVMNPLQFHPSVKLDEGRIMQNIRDLVRHGWYWGPLTKEEAEEKLFGSTDGTFLVRDSSDERHLLTISFRTSTKTFHTRIEFWKGKFSVFPNGTDDSYDSVGQLIDHAMNHCKNGVFFYSRRHEQPSIALPVCLIKPLSRFLQLRSLQHHCRFVIRQYTRLDLIKSLPLPSRIQDYVLTMSIL